MEENPDWDPLHVDIIPFPSLFSSPADATPLPPSFLPPLTTSRQVHHVELAQDGALAGRLTGADLQVHREDAVRAAAVRV